MELQAEKQQIIMETMLDDSNIEKELLQSTPYELVVINRSQDDLLANFSAKTVAIIYSTTPITTQVVSQMPPSIKVITRRSTGYERIDIKAYRQRNIEVCYVPDYGTDTVADHAVDLVFAAQRRLLNFHKAIVDKHIWNGRMFGKLNSLNTTTLGVIGLGRIGTSFADKMRPFVKQILIHHSKNPASNTLQEIFEQCDIISLHIPYSSANHHLISSDSIARMTRRPIIINVSRGALIDTKALIQALKSGQISYAALDIVEGEPSIDEELIKLDNVLLTPHAAWNSVESERLLREKAVEETFRVLRGEKPIHPVPE